MPATMKKRANVQGVVNDQPSVRKRKTAVALGATDLTIGGSAADDVPAFKGNGPVSSNTNGVGGDGVLASRATKQAASGDVANDAEWKIARRSKKQSAMDRMEPLRLMPTGGGGELLIVTEYANATTANTTRAGGHCFRDAETRLSACRALQSLQRRRVQTLKCRNSIDRQLASLVAIELGYAASQEESDRKARFAAAEKIIAAIDNGDELTPEQQAIADTVGGIVLAVRMGRNSFDVQLKAIEKEMVRLAKTLPVAKWCEGVKGFGLKSLAVIIGETGDLSFYAGPAKVWKRLGLAPINGKMGSTWKRKGGLSAEEWTSAGYSPRRRSVVYVIGECLLKQNDGEYRKQYDKAKATKMSLESEDWPKIRCHLHGMLLSTKLLVKHLWKNWNNA